MNATVRSSWHHRVIIIPLALISVLSGSTAASGHIGLERFVGTGTPLLSQRATNLEPVYVVLVVKRLAFTFPKDYGQAEALLRAQCIDGELVPLLAENNFDPKYLGVATLPADATPTHVLTLEYTETKGREYQLGLIGVNMSLELTLSNSGDVVWRRHLQAETSPTVKLGGRGTYLDAFDNLGKACRDFRQTFRKEVKIGSDNSAPQLPTPDSALSGSPVDAARTAIERIRHGRFITMPSPASSPTAGPVGRGLTIQNVTVHALRIYFVGPTTRVIDVPAGAALSVELVVGAYELAAEVPNTTVVPFYGKHTYEMNLHYWLKFSAVPQ